jgi:hypothetical protein
MQSAQSITLLSHSARNEAGIQGLHSALTVNFSVFRKGPAHVAGLIYTTDGWISTGEQPARFQSFSGDTENWQVVVRVGGNNVTFQYVIFCDDFAGVNAVPRVYNTDGGNQFSVTSSF